MYIPTIPDIQESDIKTRFKYQNLTEIEGRPDYTKLYNARRELCRNALAVKCSFGGGKYGTLGLVLEDSVYQAETGVLWTVPASQGSYPNFSQRSTDLQKKAAIAEFIQNEGDIKKVNIVEELLKNQFIDCIDESFIMELRQGIREYDGVTLRDILLHVFANYGRMDDHLVNKNMDKWREPPGMDLPIDVYFAKQEECQRLA